eukprot:331849_1
MKLVSNRWLRELSKLPTYASHLGRLHTFIDRHFHGDNMNYSDDEFTSCITQLQSVSHTLYYQSMLMDSPSKDTSKSLMELSQTVDNIVLKLNTIKQNKTVPSLETKVIKSVDTQQSTVLHDVGKSESVVTQQDVDEINQEMEDLFGSPLSVPVP